MNQVWIDYEHLVTLVEEHPYPLLFVTVCGPHQVGFGPVESQLELRGVHAVPYDQITADGSYEEIFHKSYFYRRGRVSLVTRDVATFNRMLLGGDSESLEYLYSPLVVRTSSVHYIFKAAGKEYLSPKHVRDIHHRAQFWLNCLGEESAKPSDAFLHAYRILLMGLHLLQTRRIETDLVKLAKEMQLHDVEQLAKQNRYVSKPLRLNATERRLHARELKRLAAELESMAAATVLVQPPTEKCVFDQMLTFSRFYLASEQHKRS